MTAGYGKAGVAVGGITVGVAVGGTDVGVAVAGRRVADAQFGGAAAEQPQVGARDVHRRHLVLVAEAERDRAVGLERAQRRAGRERLAVAAAGAVPIFAEVPVRAEAPRFVVALAVGNPAGQGEAIGQWHGDRFPGIQPGSREPEARGEEPGGQTMQKPAHRMGQAMARLAGSASVHQWVIQPAQIAPATTTASAMR